MFVFLQVYIAIYFQFCVGGMMFGEVENKLKDLSERTRKIRGYL